MKRIQVGFGCDNGCLFCAQGRLRESAPAHDDVEAQILGIAPGDVVAFVGGEPCLRDELRDWVAAAAARSASRVVVQTNGRRLAVDGRARRLAEAGGGLLTFDVSLHGASAAMHDYHTSVEGSFDATVRGACAAVEARVPVGFTVVVTRSNFRHLSEIVVLAAQIGARAVHFAGVEAVGAALARQARLVPAAELVAPHLARAAQAARAAGLGVLAASVAEPESTRDLFAGLGEIDDASASSHVAEASPAPRARLPMLGKPQPGRGEEHGADKRSGDALRVLFPELFEGEAGAAELRAGRG